MTKILATTLAISAMFFAPLTSVQAGDDHNAGQHKQHSETHKHDGMMGNSGMREHMGQMKQTMNRIQNTDDPAERRELMKQHRQQIHQSMGSMCKMMDGRKESNGAHEHGMMGKINMDPEMHRKMMKEHMEMMENMMEQMKAHMQADQAMQDAQ